MAKHTPVVDCQVPPGTAEWTCPMCGTPWYWDPKAGKGTDLWEGNSRVRLANGRKPKTTIWEWLTS